MLLILLSSNVLMKQHPLPIFFGNMLLGIIIPLFISSDPVQFPHRYHRKEDIEISGFLTAYLSFGARPQILKAAERLDAVMQHMPLVYVLSKDWKSDFCGEESFLSHSVEE